MLTPQKAFKAQQPARRKTGVLELGDWLQTHPRTLNEKNRGLREEFLLRFPKEKLPELTLEQYAPGYDKNTFCNWLEYKSRDLGSIKSQHFSKFGVWYANGEWDWRRKIYSSKEDALDNMKAGITELIGLVESKTYKDLDRESKEILGVLPYSVRCKILNLYFLDEFLPIYQSNRLKHFLRVFGVEPQGENFKLNRQLLDLLRSLPEFEGFDNYQMMYFLHDRFHPPKDKRENSVMT